MEPFVAQHIMIDIETFGLRPKGLVVSIGAVGFRIGPGGAEFGGPAHEYHAALSWGSAQDEIKQARFEIDPSTMAWWQEENKPAFERLRSMMRASGLGPAQLMGEFNAWIAKACQGGAKVWGNAPSFDLVLIENMSKTLGVGFGVPFRAEGDYRTLMDQVYGADKPKGAPVDAHDALADARFQAQACAQALRSIAAWKQLAAAVDWREAPPVQESRKSPKI